MTTMVKVDDTAFQKETLSVYSKLKLKDLEAMLPEECRDCKQAYMTCFTCKQIRSHDERL